MAVRFNSSTDRLLRSSDLLDYDAAYTVMFWVMIVTDLNAYSTFLSINANLPATAEIVGTASDGTTLRLSILQAAPDIGVNGSALTVGSWYHVAIVRESSSSCKVYLDGVLDISRSDSVSRSGPSRMEFGAHTSANLERGDIRICGVKAWSSYLTQAEVARERLTIVPRRFSNIYGWWPCFSNTGRNLDFSGKGRNWSEGGSLTNEGAAPVMWGAGRNDRFVVIPAAALPRSLALLGVGV